MLEERSIGERTISSKLRIEFLLSEDDLLSHRLKILTRKALIFINNALLSGSLIEVLINSFTIFEELGPACPSGIRLGSTGWSGTPQGRKSLAVGRRHDTICRTAIGFPFQFDAPVSCEGHLLDRPVLLDPSELLVAGHLELETAPSQMYSDCHCA